MKASLICLVLTVFFCAHLYSQTKPYDTNSVIITRIIMKDLFEANSVPFMQPLVTTINVASNSRFFNQAKVPKKVSKPYFRFGIHTMVGFVRDDQRTYSPTLPTEKRPYAFLDSQYVSYRLLPTPSVIIRDTAGLAVSIVKRLFQKGIDSGYVVIPGEAATIFGNSTSGVEINTKLLVSILSSDPEFSLFYSLLDSANKARIVGAVEKLPAALTLPTGQNMNTVFAAVPQLEVGSLWGTELLLRYIPPVKWDSSIGKFSFFGMALKHSISQYFRDSTFELAVQAGYQGTNLANTVGVTGSELVSSASFWTLNVHASKEFKGICEVFTGLDFEAVDINSAYSYTLPQEVQISLGLLVPDPPKGAHRDSVHPGDDVIQVSRSHFTDKNLKWTIGVLRTIGPFAIFVDYSISKFNIFSGGIEFRF